MRFALPSGFGYFPRFLRSLSLGSLRLGRAGMGALALAALSACSSESGAPPPSHGTGAADLAGGACNVVPTSVTGLDASHVAVCSEVSYPDNPPAGGYHYPYWAAFQSFSFPVPRGFWVHDLEHGAIVFSYNCADGCADEVARVQALIDALPTDPVCAAENEVRAVEARALRRVVLTPDPLLDVRWGVSAWGFTLRAECVDEQRFRQFYLNHFALGPEDFCAAGIDFGGMPPCE